MTFKLTPNNNDDGCFSDYSFGKNVKIVHFLGATKPWHHSFDAGAGGLRVAGHPGHAVEHLQLWWNIFVSEVVPMLDFSSVRFTYLVFLSVEVLLSVAY